jgi:hypothetical protein
MSARTLLDNLTRRGWELRADGSVLRWKAPRGDARPEDLAALAEHKCAILAQLARPEPPPAADLIGEAVAVETRSTVGAVRLRSRFGEVWVAVEPGMFDALVAEERARGCAARPVLHLLDVLALRGRSDAAIRAVFEIARAFPGARLEPQ